MTADYRLFFVQEVEQTPGQGKRAMDWFEEHRRWLMEDSHVTDVRMYATQFGLGRKAIEVWTEIDSYAAMDDWDHMPQERIERYLKIAETYSDTVTYGTSRLMGDWPGSSVYATD